MVCVDPLLGLGVEPLDFRVGEVIHDIQVVRREIDDDAHVSNSSGKRPEPARLQLAQPADLTCADAALKLADRRIESFDVPDAQHEPGTAGL